MIDVAPPSTRTARAAMKVERDGARNNAERVIAILTPLFVKAQETDSPDEETIGGSLDVLTGWFGQNGLPLRKLDELEKERDELRAENERLRVKAITDKEWIDGCHRALKEKDAQLDEVRRVVRSGIPIDREDALAAWRRLEAAERIRAERTLQATTHEIAELRAANERLHKENDCLKAQNSLLKMHLEDK
jgi:cell division protein FtsB